MNNGRQTMQDQDEIQKFYNSVYYKNAAAGTGILRHYDRLAAKINVQPGQEVLDVACGTGEWLLAVKARGAVPAGIDLSQKAVPNKDFLTDKLGLFGGTEQHDIKEDVRTLEDWQELFEAADLKVIKRWKDLHVLSWSWISQKKWYHIPLRAAQALALAVWPLSWQYQVYHLCKKK
jgi:SAM-dependent methyltransferase